MIIIKMEILVIQNKIDTLNTYIYTPTDGHQDACVGIIDTGNGKILFQMFSYIVSTEDGQDKGDEATYTVSETL